MSLFRWCFSDNALKYKLRALLIMLDFFEIKKCKIYATNGSTQFTY